MSVKTNQVVVNKSRLPDQTTVSFIHLRVANITTMSAFYEKVMGFREISREGRTARFSPTGSEPAVLILTEQPDARPRPRTSPGLYHAAYLVPNRKELARTMTHIGSTGWRFQGFADHGVSEALYLADPEGNGIEIYRDRPRIEWTHKGSQIEMVTEGLDLDGLLAELDDEQASWQGIDPDTRLGHIHLQVSDLDKTEQFYAGQLGFDITQRSYPGALFLSAGGYHHHIGANTWNSRGSLPPAEPTTGLLSIGIRLPESRSLETLIGRMTEFGRIAGTKGKEYRAKDFDEIEVSLTAGVASTSSSHN